MSETLILPRTVLEALEPERDESAFPGDETQVTAKEKVKLFLLAHWGGIVCIVTPILLLSILIPFPPEKYQWCAYTLILMAVYWVTECIPLPITSFLPILIFPMTGVMNTSQTCYCYMNDTIVMFLGSLILAYAVEQSGLHKRLALCAIRTIGYSHYRLLFAMSFTTMFVSMWITNTAATTMMVPINFAILKVFEDQNLLRIYETDSHGNTVASDTATCYFCSASFSATIGGIGTIVGTATNLVFKGLFSRAYPNAPEYLSFPNFSAFAIPYMLAMEGCLYLSMLIMYFGFLRPNSDKAKSSQISKEGIEAAKAAVDEEWKNLGKLTFWEIMVIILFSGAMVMFFSRSPQIFVGWGDKIESHFGLKDKFVRDSAAAMLVGFLMFLLPSTLEFFQNFTSDIKNLPHKPVRSILDWRIMNDVMPYSFMFLLGGGFALSEAAKPEYSDLNGKIGDILKALSSLPKYFIILLIIIFTVFITNFAANVAVCNVITPIVMQLKQNKNMYIILGKYMQNTYETVEPSKDRYKRSIGSSTDPNHYQTEAFPTCWLQLDKIQPLGHVSLRRKQAKEINTNPLWFNITAGFSASYCFCLPVGTPGNLIVQGAASIPTGKMIKAGLFPTISAVCLTWICICFWAPVIWPDLHTLPAWIAK